MARILSPTEGTRVQRRNLRYAAIAALTNELSAPWPTLAEDRVYDSRVDPYIHAEEQQNQPCIAVYTDQHHRIPYTTDKDAKFKSTIDLVLELSAAGAASYAYTERRLEWLLDELEEQAIQALFALSSGKGVNFSRFYNQVSEISSQRLGNADNQSRVAMRDLTIRLEIGPRCPDLSTVFPEFERLYANLAPNDELITQAQETA